MIQGKSLRHRALGATAMLAAAGCGVAGEGSSRWAGTVDTLADGIHVTTTIPAESPWPPRTRLAADTLWLGEELERPSHIALAGDSVYYVADVTRIFRLNGGTVEQVRPVDTTYAYHPYWLRQLPHLRPASYLWEVFGVDGKLAARYELPSTFTPLAIAEGRMVGTLVGEDGVKVIAQVTLPGR